jgi:hypothetical protein
MIAQGKESIAIGAETHPDTFSSVGQLYLLCILALAAFTIVHFKLDAAQGLVVIVAVLFGPPIALTVVIAFYELAILVAATQRGES